MERLITALFILLFVVKLSESGNGPIFSSKQNRPSSKPTAVQCGVSNKYTIMENKIIDSNTYAGSDTSSNKPVVDNKIVGGAPTTVELYPWFAALANRMLGGGYQVSCGASLILPDRLLTAAHCYDGDSKKPRETRFLVVFNLNNRLKDTGKIAPVRKVIIHEKYQSSGNLPDHDIAMIMLVNPLSYPNTPVCLPSQSRDYYNGRIAIIMGYGSTKVRNGEYPKQILKTRIKIYSQEECLKSGIGPNLAEKTICAGRLEGGVDACDGDSGGPMVVFENGRFELLGIVSYGEGCGRKNLPGVYSDVTKHGLGDWIERNIRNSEYTQVYPDQQGSNASPPSSPPSSPSSPSSPANFPPRPSFGTHPNAWNFMSDDEQQRINNFLNVISQLHQRPRFQAISVSD